MLNKTSIPTLFTAQNLLFFDSLASTNTHAQKLLEENHPPEGTAILTIDQTAGRGQTGSVWVSEPGMNVLCSFIFYPTFLEPTRQFLLNQVISLAVIDALKKIIGQQFLIKWPNDIYFGEKKVAGILIENSIRGNSFVNSVVGIGLNVNQKIFPPEISNPISLAQISNKNLINMEVFATLAIAIEQRYLQLRNEFSSANIQKEYLNNLLGYDELREYKIGLNKIKAILKNVDETGRLLLSGEDGIKYTAWFKEIEFVF